MPGGKKGVLMGKYEIAMEFGFSMEEENIDRHGNMYGVSVNTENDYDYN